MNGSRLLYVTDESLLSSSSSDPAFTVLSTSRDVFLSDVLSALPTHIIMFTDVYHSQC